MVNRRPPLILTYIISDIRDLINYADGGDYLYSDQDCLDFAIMEFEEYVASKPEVDSYRDVYMEKIRHMLKTRSHFMALRLQLP